MCNGNNCTLIKQVQNIRQRTYHSELRVHVCIGVPSIPQPEPPCPAYRAVRRIGICSDDFQALITLNHPVSAVLHLVSETTLMAREGGKPSTGLVIQIGLIRI